MLTGKNLLSRQNFVDAFSQVCETPGSLAPSVCSSEVAKKFGQRSVLLRTVSTLGLRQGASPLNPAMPCRCVWLAC